MTALGYNAPLRKSAALYTSRPKAPAVADVLRLRRREPSVADGFVDGGWWPRSLDLSAGLPGLLAAFRSTGHEVARVVYNPAAWDPAPRTLTVSGSVVTLDGARSQEPALLSLIEASGAIRAELVVIPPHTDHRVAGRILALARLGGDLRRVVGILQRADRRPPPAPALALRVDPTPVAVWETDGGRVLTP